MLALLGLGYRSGAVYVIVGAPVFAATMWGLHCALKRAGL